DALADRDAAVRDIVAHVLGLEHPLDEVGRRGPVLRALGNPEQPVAHHPQAFTAGALRNRDVGDLALDLADARVLDDTGDLAGPDRRLIGLSGGHRLRALGSVVTFGTRFGVLLELPGQEVHRGNGIGRVELDLPGV